MALTPERRITSFGIWSLRIALFSAALLMAGVLLHRFFGMATLVALNIFAMSYLGAALALFLVILAGVDIWRRGVRGKFVSSLALLSALGMFALPLSYLPKYLELPAINDVSTDVNVPPRFNALAKTRRADGGSIEFAKQTAERLQAPNYPDIRPMNINRSSEEAFELALDALRRQGLRIVSERPPDPGKGNPGWIEATDRTMFVGFYDDVIVRVAGDRRRARFDVRSASRHGRHDFGRNVERVRRIMAEFQGRLDASVGTGNERGQALASKRGRKNLKALRARSRYRKPVRTQ